jgi:hypothetical protein
VGQGSWLGRYRSNHRHDRRLAGLIITAYVGGRTIEKVARIFKR